MDEKSIAILSQDLTNAELDKRISLQELKIANIKDVVINIRDNHLVHLAADIKTVDNKLDGVSLKIAFWGGGLAVITFIVPFLIHYILK